jgi:putative membrane protein
MSIAFAFLHHLAAFALVAALAAELVLLRPNLSAQHVARIARLDAMYGTAAGVLLVVGLLRVFYFEKGAAYYFHSAPFIAKLALFIAVGLLSIYPTVTYRRWNKASVVDEASLRMARRLVHLQLAGVVLILLFAAMMARGVGFFG